MMQYVFHNLGHFQQRKSYRILSHQKYKIMETKEADFAGIAIDPFGQSIAGMTVRGKINRSDFGLTWSAVTEVGNV